jgi:hypothetical protein
VRAPAPAYRGEGSHALWHVSEDASIERFEPRAGGVSPDRPLVWAVDTRHLPMYWFPRECPRGTFWATAETSADDRERFLTGGSSRVHAVESNWLRRIREAQVMAYRLPEASFVAHDEVGGYWVTTETVEPLELLPLGDLLERHADAGIELRLVPDLLGLWERVIVSTLEFSGMRLRNATPGTA